MILLLAIAMLAAPTTVSGIVHDPSGAAVAGAEVIVRSDSGATRATVTGLDGRFSILASAGDTIDVRAAGFAESHTTIPPAGGDPLRVEIVLVPSVTGDAVTVTGTRTAQPAENVAATVTMLDRSRIQQSAGVVADEVLREVPAFSLFRRTSSLVSHPTTQGVSLRGIGPSGVSRTLVLLDDVPLNDPFGGWVYWSRVPLEGADRIEIVESPSSSLYGSYAMGGVINVASRAPAPRRFDASVQYGNHRTPRVEFDAGHVVHDLGFVVAGSALRTDGFPIVAPAERGRVDTNAATRFANLTGTAEYRASDRLRAFVRAGVFRERRLNGKKSTIDGTAEANDTSWTSASGGVRWQLPAASELRATVFTDDERFHSNFLAVPAATPARSIGRMTLDQHVPAQSVGAGTQWSRPFGASNLVTAGGDWRWVKGDSDENALDGVTGTHVTLTRLSGGRQQSAGAFAQDEIAVSSVVTVTAAARVDRWHSYDGHNLETLVPSGVPSGANAPSLPDRRDTVVSPRLGAVLRPNDRVRLWAGAGSGFRAPTLNELYRQFRVGSTLTLPNSDLGPERLVGYEAGATLTPVRGLDARATWFDDRVRDPVSNVTIASAGASVTQQRQNLGRTSVRGLEFDVDYRIGTRWTFSAGYLHDRAVVAENPAQTTLVGKLLPQVPAQRASIRGVFSARAATISGDLLYTGAQFDDDLNSRRLPSYTIVNLTASHAVRRHVDVFGSIENLFNRTYLVGTLPTTIGSPRLASIGVRVR